jgi:GMP reductase
MPNETKVAYKYSDVCLIPKKGILGSRSLADTSVYLGKRKFRLPIIPANMRCTIDPKLAHDLSQENCFYIMHRFDDTLAFVRRAINSSHFISISVGVTAEDKRLIGLIKRSDIKPEYITIDIAHGHSIQALEMVAFIKSELPDTFLIAGNVATTEGARELKSAGAAAIKVGVGQGNACTTKDKTGFTMPMFTCIQEIADAHLGLPIIADGGIRCNGDIAKAISAGATMVMCGSIFAECSDSPSNIVVGEDGTTYKLYYGSASAHNKTEHTHIEGTLKRVPQNTMTYSQKLEEIRQDLASAISYSGGKSLNDLKFVDYCVYSD